MPIIVQKYGGSSLATPAHIQEVAKLIQKRLKTGVKLCVVVSAMGKNTNQLLALAHEISKNPIRRELDMLLSCGERASMALLAMALHELEIPSMSLTGSQSGIITDEIHSGAQIVEVRPTRVLEGLEQGKVVIIAGFQGVSRGKEITTLGRGGSDTTAVAMAAALNAEACEIYSDVAGIYSADPRIVQDTKHIEALSYDEMLELAASGAKVLNAQAVEFAKLKNIEIKARKTGLEGQETVISEPSPLAPLQQLERGNRALTTQDKLFAFRFENPQALQALLSALEKLEIKPNQILGVQDGICVITPEDSHGLERLDLNQMDGVSRMADCASLSLIGNGIGDNMKLLSRALICFQSLGIPVLGLLNSKLRLYFLLGSGKLSEAAQILHRENI